MALIDETERELILDNVKSALENIIEGSPYPASVSGYYHYTPFVTREPLSYDEVKQFPTYCIVDSEESFAYHGKRVVNSFSFIVRAFHRTQVAKDGSMIRNRMAKDISAAISVDVSRGGYAGNTEAVSVVGDEGWISPVVAIEETFRVVYYTLEQNR
ncbi:MAG: hypothetical protein KKD77_21025 [Gammaproteobacteria bacterium]|nr:hypothetical protein [Gammaproteobacteria bacterium]